MRVCARLGSRTHRPVVSDRRLTVILPLSSPCVACVGYGCPARGVSVSCARIRRGGHDASHASGFGLRSSPFAICVRRCRARLRAGLPNGFQQLGEPAAMSMPAPLAGSRRTATASCIVQALGVDACRCSAAAHLAERRPEGLEQQDAVAVVIRGRFLGEPDGGVPRAASANSGPARSAIANKCLPPLGGAVVELVGQRGLGVVERLCVLGRPDRERLRAAPRSRRMRLAVAVTVATALALRLALERDADRAVKDRCRASGRCRCRPAPSGSRPGSPPT